VESCAREWSEKGRENLRAMRQIYIQDSYIRSFETRVVDTKALEAEGESVILKETAFYPQSGGQPSDAGSLFRSGDEFRVLRVDPSGPLHILDRRGLEPGDSISGIIDWDRRYRFMRSHTACHILSAVEFTFAERARSGG
jgi:misacylated tRNA(Ala) deacylase